MIQGMSVLVKAWLRERRTSPGWRASHIIREDQTRALEVVSDRRLAAQGMRAELCYALG
jgi:hypothetical protein